MPQSHKGERRYIPTRLPVADANKLIALAEATGDNRGDIIARAVNEFLQTIDLEAITGQEALPIGRLAS